MDYTKHINTLSWQNTEFLDVTTGGNSCALKGKFIVHRFAYPSSPLM
jgi:hypothetical protein